jgi:outer membrane protein TolC
MVRISNINTLRQQTINAVTLQENALKFFMGLPVDTRISIPETEFEITPNALSLAPDTTTRTEYLLLKRTSSYWNTKKSIEANYYPSLSLTGG